MPASYPSGISNAKAVHKYFVASKITRRAEHRVIICRFWSHACILAESIALRSGAAKFIMPVQSSDLAWHCSSRNGCACRLQRREKAVSSMLHRRVAWRSHAPVQRLHLEERGCHASPVIADHRSLRPPIQYRVTWLLQRLSQSLRDTRGRMQSQTH